MNINFINSTSYHDAMRRVCKLIDERKRSLDERHLLIVPEQYTLMAEKYLYEESEGSFDVEVLSPSRLFYKMQLDTPLISREGAIMLIRGMLPSLKLNCFFRSAGYRGFCEKLYDVINDFAGSGVAPGDIPDASPKLADLKTIYSAYTARIEGKYVDAMGKLALIARDAPKNSYLDNTHVYIANFDFADKATRKVFDALKARALSYTECIVEPEFKIPPAEKYFGEGALAVKEAAKRMRFLAYHGMNYEDMAVIIGNADVARVKRIFGEFGIPCFIAESKRLSDHPLAVFVAKLFDCASSKRRHDVTELSKNVYSGVSAESAEFENYVNSRLIDYKGFEEPFEEAEDVRARLMSLISIVEKGKKNVRDARSFARLLDAIFAAVAADGSDEALNTDAVIEKMRALVALMEQVDIRGNFDFISAVFAEGLKATKISELPYEGGVIVGSPAAFRGGKYKFLVILGFDDGFLPQIYDDSSLIGDDEKGELTQMERADMINKRYETELCAVISSSDAVFVTYYEPSGMMNELFADARGCFEDDDLLFAGCKKHAVEQLISLYKRAENNGENNSARINLLHDATGADDKLFMPTRVSTVSGADKLFFPSGTTSVSQLQSYFKCPFRHFMDYGLRVKERDKGELSPLDVGSFMHLVVEKVVREGDYSDIKSSVKKAIERILSEGGKYSLDANRSTVEALGAEVTAALEILASHFGKSDFVPIGQEMKFETDLDGIKLTGKIDMADRFGDYIRLIDYKTGNSSLTYSDVYYGKKIQLPLYMAAAERLGYKKAAMFNFPLSYDWLDDKRAHVFAGFFLRDETIYRAMDKSLGSTGESEVLPLKLKNDKIGRNDYAIDAAFMDEIVDYAVRVAQNAVVEMKGGYVACSPCGSKECEFCDYMCLCADKKERKIAKVEKSNFGGGK